jgi:hypothetical protein
MSATDTAQRVIEWAMATGNGVPPQGDVSATEQLAHPSAPLRSALGQLTALTAARLRLGMPALGDSGPIGVGALIIAAAIGVANVPEAAAIVMRAVPPATAPIDWIARHGVVVRALPFLPDAFADECRHASPLTAMLDRPTTGQDAQAIGVMDKLLKHPAGRLSLTLHFAQPTPDVHVREWRQDLLERMRLSNQDFVLDIYEAMMIHHQREALDQVKAARAVIIDRIAASEEQRLRDALSVADWWGPLWALERANVDALRARRYLGYAYRDGIALFQLARRMRGLV